VTPKPKRRPGMGRMIRRGAALIAAREKLHVARGFLPSEWSERDREAHQAAIAWLERYVAWSAYAYRQGQLPPGARASRQRRADAATPG
jgi:hypothetical protein